MAFIFVQGRLIKCSFYMYTGPECGHCWAWWHPQIETFSALLALCAGNHWGIPLTKASDKDLWCFLWSVPHKGRWHGSFMFPLICAWTNSWVNNPDTGDLRYHHAHYDVIVMDGAIPWADKRWPQRLTFFQFFFWLSVIFIICWPFYNCGNDQCDLAKLIGSFGVKQHQWVVSIWACIMLPYLNPITDK